MFITLRYENKFYFNIRKCHSKQPINIAYKDIKTFPLLCRNSPRPLANCGMPNIILKTDYWTDWSRASPNLPLHYNSLTIPLLHNLFLLLYTITHFFRRYFPNLPFIKKRFHFECLQLPFSFPFSRFTPFWSSISSLLLF